MLQNKKKIMKIG